MPAMPYVLEVGRILSWVVDYVEEPAHLRRLFDQLKDGTPLTKIDRAQLAESRERESPGPAEPVCGNHPGKPHRAIGSDGRSRDARRPVSNRTTPLRARIAPAGGSSGTVTPKRSSERRCSAPRRSPSTSRAGRTPRSTRHWHMQFLWVCGAPFLQGWVNWQEWGKGADAGMVTVTFTTPGNGHKLYATPRVPAGKLPNPDADYEDPATTVEEYGLWVIGEAETEVVHPPGATFQTSGAGYLPAWINAFVHTSGEVIAVSPAELDGGVLGDGRKWRAP